MRIDATSAELDFQQVRRSLVANIDMDMDMVGNS